ncbi:MAG: hypothetical protein H0S84_11630 [Bacteroidales bacterium]|jgi:antitoxin component YwqK of YwqJK toxin-antitoxin module|nr:hypothetical protein [Bacteroidales bacterium]
MNFKTFISLSFLSKIMVIAFMGWLIPPRAHAQEMLNQKDDNGRKTGIWKGYHADGSLRYEGHFVNDRPQGVFTYYDEAGRIKATNCFDPTGRKAYHQAFDSTGFKLAEGVYLNQKKDSIWTFYSAADSAVIARETYHNDIKQGLSVTYYPQNGQPAEERYYENGKLNGSWTKYFEDGTIMIQGYYENNMLHGPYTTYHPNGQVQTKGQYKNDLQHGVWDFFDENGNLINTEKYQLKE